MVEKRKFFKLILFSFIVGNEDMHLKNFSVITRNNRVELSPAYDLLNSSVIFGNEAEESALMLAGKRKNLSRKDLIDYFGAEKLGLNQSVIAQVLQELQYGIPHWKDLINQSFLEDPLRSVFLQLMDNRISRLFI